MDTSIRRNVQINYAIGAASSVREVLELTERDCAALNLVNCVTALQKMAKLPASPSSPVRVLQGGAGAAGAASHLTARAVQCLAVGQMTQLLCTASSLCMVTCK